MELNILESSKNRLVVEIKGEDHTFCNILKEELQNDSKVKNATYAITHPSIGTPTLLVETQGSAKPKDVLMDAAKKVKKSFAGFKKSIEKEIK
jgi:DNA-directed RNA polymerase subunit L